MEANFLAKNEIERVSNAVAAGTTAVNTSAVSTANLAAVTFVALLGTITATGVPSMKIQGSNDGGSNWADLAGTNIAGDDADDNKMIASEIVAPTYSSLRAVITRATANVVVDGVLAIKHAKRVAPVTHGSTVVDAETHVSPDAGTA